LTRHRRRSGSRTLGARGTRPSCRSVRMLARVAGSCPPSPCSLARPAVVYFILLLQSSLAALSSSSAACALTSSFVKQPRPCNDRWQVLLGLAVHRGREAGRLSVPHAASRTPNLTHGPTAQGCVRAHSHLRPVSTGGRAQQAQRSDLLSANWVSHHSFYRSQLRRISATPRQDTGRRRAEPESLWHPVARDKLSGSRRMPAIPGASLGRCASGRGTAPRQARPRAHTHKDDAYL
jgi:hypothetical protein